MLNVHPAARLLSGQSTTLSSTFSPLSDAERGRRVQYRHDFSGKLPWEVRGLGTKNDDNIPEMALEVLEAEQGLPDLGRGTLDSACFCRHPLAPLNTDWQLTHSHCSPAKLSAGPRGSDRTCGTARQPDP